MGKSFIITVILALSMLTGGARAAYGQLPIPAFTMNPEGGIEITGEGTSELTRPEMLLRTVQWVYDSFEGASLEKDPMSGILVAKGSFLIADEVMEDGSMVMEFMEYNVTVECDDYRYAYSIDNVSAYVVTVEPAADWEQPSEEVTDIPLRIVESVPIEMPGDYVLLINDSFEERGRLRSELESMLEADVSGLSRSKLRRHEQELGRTADWFSATDNYYRAVKENYMACYNFLTGLPVSLETALAG